MEASEAGQKSIEHAFAFLWDCYPDIDKIRQSGNPGFYETENMRKMIDQHDSKLCNELFNTFVKNNTYYCPTHLTRKMEAYAGDREFRNDTRLKYIPSLFRNEWNNDADSVITYDKTEPSKKTTRDFYLKGLELTGKAHKAGVKILAGTDATDTYCFPGFSLHDELEELVKAGLTPLDALRAATVTPAEFFNMKEVYGLVEEGYNADLIILNSNPLEKISNTREIEAVIHNGRIYSRPDLQDMLKFTEKQANSINIGIKLLWQAVSRG